MSTSNRYASGGAVTALDRRKQREALVTLGIVVGVCLTIIGLIVLYLWLSWQRVYWADQVTTTRQQIYETSLEEQRLQATVATEFSVDRISRFAKQQGMIEPDPQFWPLEP
jgi:cell division protein FtsL